MTNVSRHKINEPDYVLAHRELVVLISSLNKQNASVLIEELCTEAEKIMLVKRFAAILLFSHKYSAYRVATVVGISVSTAQRLYRQYEQAEFEGLLRCVTKKQQREFVSLIEDFLLSRVSHKARTRLARRALNL